MKHIKEKDLIELSSKVNLALIRIWQQEKFLEGAYTDALIESSLKDAKKIIDNLLNYEVKK